MFMQYNLKNAAYRIRVCSILCIFAVQNKQYKLSLTMIVPEITAAEAASMIENGDLLAVGGFGPAGSPKVITPALAQRARLSK